MDSRQRDIVIEMKLLFKKLVKLAVLKRGSLIGTIVKTFIGLMKDTVIDSKIMKNGVLQIREFRHQDHEERCSSDQGIHGNRNGWKEKRLS